MTRAEPTTHRVQFPVSNGVSQEIRGCIEKIREGADRKAVARPLGRATEQLVGEAIDHFLLDIADRLELTGVGRKTVELGSATAKRGFTMIIKPMIRTLSRRQLTVVAEFLDELLVENEDGRG